MKKTKPETVDDLHFDPQNARSHDDRNIDLIAAALGEVGAARSIVIDETNTIRAGNGTVEAARKIGITKVHVVDVDGDTLVAVRRSNLSPEQKTRLALFDNRTAELGAWNADVIEALQAAGIPVNDLWTDEELASMTEGDEAAAVKPVKIDRPTDVAWILCAIPLAHWPENQHLVEALQQASVFTTMVLRPHQQTEEKPK
jgi:hypothetical protein